MNHPSSRCPGPLSRRDFLRIGSLSLGGVGLSNLLGLRAAAKEAGRTTPDTSVIFLWLPGGPPHMETYDMKPDAPAEYRGDFKPIRTKRARTRCLRVAAAARSGGRQVRPDSLYCSQLRRPRRRHEAPPHRPRPRHAGGLRHHSSDGRLPGGQVPRTGPLRGAELYRRHRSRPAGHRCLRLRFGLSRIVNPAVHLCRRPQRPEVPGAEPGPVAADRSAAARAPRLCCATWTVRRRAATRPT